MSALPNSFGNSLDPKIRPAPALGSETISGLDSENARTKVFLLSGQGSQYPQMGRGFYDRNPVYRRSIEALDAVAAERLGFPILPLLYGAGVRRSDPLTRTLTTHPAIFMVEVSLCRALIAAGCEPDCLLGSSLGEYAAAAVSGAVGDEEMLLTVIDCAELIERRCEAGAMMAILGSSDESYYDDPLVRDRCTLVGINLEDHFVVSGSRDDIEDVRKHLASKRVVTSVLPVSHAFHSAALDVCMAPKQDLFAALTVHRPQIPLFSACLGGAVTRLDKEYFASIGRLPIQFPSAVRALSEHFSSPCDLIDVGPSGTLAAIVRKLPGARTQHRVFTTMTPFGDDSSVFDELSAARKSVTRAHTPPAPAAKSAVVFPGQGAQFQGMGEALFAAHPEQVLQATAILGWSPVEICRDNPDNCLRDTRYTQTALFVVNALSYLDYISAGGRPPDILAGHSLGEYSALFAAGILDFETGLRIVKQRAELMSTATVGAMAAVIGLEAKQIARVLEQSGCAEVDLANQNSPSQVVISGVLQQIVKAEQVLKDAGAKAVLRLPVSGAFHSRLMRPAAAEFAKFLDNFSFGEAQIKVIANATGKPYGSGNVAELLAKQIDHPVYWQSSIEAMLADGVETFVELGPKKVLSSMIREIQAVWDSRESTDSVPTSIESGGQAPAPAPEPGSEDRAAGFSMEGFELGGPSAARFCEFHGLRLPYVCGAMVHGIASVEMVVRAAKAGILSFFGSGALPADSVEDAIERIQAALTDGEPYGINLLNGPQQEQHVELFLKHGVRQIEASAFITVTPALVRYRVLGLRQDGTSVVAQNRIMAKLSRPEVADAFLRPPPGAILDKLLSQGHITGEQAQLAQRVPMADDICVEADSGGHTDKGVMAVLLPYIVRQRDQAMVEHGYADPIRVGAGGGIGSPEAVVAAFVLGASFVTTGSINQCSVEAGTSDLVKDMLEEMSVQDTAYAPAGDMFELGARIQVLKRGVFFPARANKLYDLYRQTGSLDALPMDVRATLEKKIFQRSIAEVWSDCVAFHPESVIAAAERSPKHKMALVFRWYFGLSNRWALAGDASRKVDFQIHCGPALGTFNQWLQLSGGRPWRERHVEQMAAELMAAANALWLNRIAGTRPADA